LADVLARLDAIAARLDQPTQPEARYLSVEGSATYSSISTDSVRRLLSAGKLRALRPVRGRIVIDRSELDALILSSDQKPRKGRGMRR
jgi:excisionase family DNA binding protein